MSCAPRCAPRWKLKPYCWGERPKTLLQHSGLCPNAPRRILSTATSAEMIALHERCRLLHPSPEGRVAAATKRRRRGGDQRASMHSPPPALLRSAPSPFGGGIGVVQTGSMGNRIDRRHG